MDSEGYDEWGPDYQLQKVNAGCSCKFAAWIICEGLDEIFYLHSIFYYITAIIRVIYSRI